MARIVEITDLSVPELRLFANLTEPQLRNRIEPEKGIFIAESHKVIMLALQAGYQPVALLMEHKRITGLGRDIIASCGDIPVYTGERELLANLTGYKLTRGILGAFHRPSMPTVELLCHSATRVAVLQGMTDATNVGAIFRSAAALDIDAVLVMDSCCDPLCRRSVRVSMGTIFQIPWTRMENDLAVLSYAGFKTVAMALDNTAINVDDPQVMNENRLALIFGSEGFGLPHDIVTNCDYVVKIPMSHHVDSLNVAAASAVAFWQLRNR